jgi:hypothetical protein
MRIRVLSLLFLLIAGSLTLSLIRGQEQPIPPGPPAVLPAPGALPAPAKVDAPTKLAGPARDFSRLPPLPRQMLFAARRGADWLYRMNGIKGRFLPGYLPALKKEMEADHFLNQAGAAYALAHSARLLGEERYAARAAQAIFALLEETAPGRTNSTVRHTVLPSAAVNRLGAAALLVLAINELPAPQPDLLDKSEQLCNYVRSQARPDGSLALNEAGDPPTDDEVNQYPGLALYALLRSQKHRPTAWKLDLARKALPFYAGWWRTHKNLAFVPWQTAAAAEAYLQSRERPFSDFVNEMSDWICTLQYAQIDRDLSRVLWCGGFMSYVEGRPLETAPDVGCAAYAEGLAQACRVAREVGDSARHTRYSEALERCLQFLATLQYTEANTQHFADWYRPRLLGAFHASHVDGNLRIDNTQRAVSALALYIEFVGS